MAVERHISVQVSEMNSQENLSRFQGITIDNLVWATIRGTETLIAYENQSKGTLNEILVGDSLATLLTKANASGYTENGFVIVPVTKINNNDYAPAKDFLLNRVRFQEMVKLTVGTLLHYQTEALKNNKVIETSDDLVQGAGGGSASMP